MHSIKTSLIAEILFFSSSSSGQSPSFIGYRIKQEFFFVKENEQNEIKIKKFKTETTSGTVTSLITPILSISWIELFALYIIIAFLFQTLYLITIIFVYARNEA